MTKVFLNELSGNTNTLGEKLNFAERMLQRKESYTIALHQSSHINPNFLIYILIISFLVFAFYKNRSQEKAAKATATTTFFFFVFSLVFYSIYSSHVKSWYVFSLSLIFPLFIGSSISLLNPSKLFYKVTSIFIVIISLIAVFNYQKEYLASQNFKTPNDPSAYTNQIKIVDDVYTLADGGSFYVYNYIPSVYDYPFQYLFWSHGLNKYGYSPNDLAYLPNQPEYIKNKNSYLKNTKVVYSGTPTILIIQTGDNKTHLQEWMGNFAHLCEQKKLEYSFNQKVLYLKPCSTK